MARMGKPNVVRTIDSTSFETQDATRAASMGVEAVQGVETGAASANAGTPTGKKMNPKLLATLQKRKKGGRPGRRGRQPKNVEYSPEHQDDSYGEAEPDYEGIEYDTGIRVKNSSEDRGISFEFEFDEELNFDY